MTSETLIRYASIGAYEVYKDTYERAKRNPSDANLQEELKQILEDADELLQKRLKTK